MCAIFEKNPQEQTICGIQNSTHLHRTEYVELLNSSNAKNQWHAKLARENDVEDTEITKHFSLEDMLICPTSRNT